jgi:non-specific serine/threonine protein kinase
MALPTFALTPQNAAIVEQVCRRLDGIPLAIELAAARVKLLSVEQIAERLADSFRLLTRGSRSALPRHQTLQETMDWSYRLLSVKEQTLLRRLAVFSGGFTLVAAERVCSDQDLAPGEILDVLSSLQDKSLTEVQQRDDEARNYLLETVRQYAHEKLIESGQVERVRDRHLEFFVSLAEQANPMSRDTWQPAVMSQFQTELDNLRAALEWSTTDAQHAQLGLKLVSLMAGFLKLRGDFSGSRDWLVRLLEEAKTTAPPAWRASALHCAATAEMLLGHFDAAVALAQESVTLARELGDEPRLAEALYALGGIRWLTNLSATARPILEESLAICRRLNDSFGVAYALSDLGRIVYDLGDHSLGRAYLEESLTLAREGKWDFIIARSAYALCDVVRHEGDLTRAKSLIKEALTTVNAAINWGLPFLTESRAHLAMAEGALSQAALLFGAAEHVYHMVGFLRVPLLQYEYDQSIAALREALGEDGFAACWTDGHALTMPQVFEFVLNSC